MRKLKTMTLREAGVILLDCVHATPAAVPDGYPYVAIPQMKNGRIDFTDARRISQADFEEWTKKARPQKYDVVLSRRTNPGVTATFGENCDFALGQNLVLLRANGKHVFPPFLRWLAISPAWWREIEKYNNVGAIFDSLKCADVPRFELPIPLIEHQEWVASVLGALDDKIDLNRRMNETLEAMARVIFKDWFVNFGPTRAKMEGRAPYLSPKIWALFPDRLDDEGKPEGWQTRTLRDIAKSAGQTIDPELLDADTPYIALEHMPRRSLSLGRWDRAEKATSGKFSFRKHDVLFGKLRPYFHKVGIAAVDGVCSTDIVVVRANTDELSSFLIPLISSDTFVAFTDRTSEGTKMPRSSWDRMARYTFTMPRRIELSAFHSAVSAAFCAIVGNTLENRVLASTRDLLLPKLMSGELRARDAERVVEAAL